MRVAFGSVLFQFEVKHVGDNDGDISSKRKWKGSHHHHATISMCIVFIEFIELVRY